MKRKHVVSLVFFVCVLAVGGFGWHVNSHAARASDVAGEIFAMGYEAKFSNDEQFWIEGSNRDFVSRSNISWWLKGDLEAIRVMCGDSDAQSFAAEVRKLKRHSESFSRVVVPVEFFRDTDLANSGLEQLVQITEYECD